MSPLHTYRVCGRPQIRSGHVTGNCDPDHILAEIKESGVFEFTVTMTAVQNSPLRSVSPEQRQRVVYFIKATTSGSGLSITALRRYTSGR